MTLENKFNEQIAPERFEIVGARPSDADSLNKKQISFWQEVMYRFSHNKLAIIGLVILSFITIMAIFAPMFSSWSYEENTG
ncbi:MAG: ABC transporter permease, partial [Solibacillus sp.]